MAKKTTKKTNTNGKHAGGRPTKLDDLFVKKLEEAFSLDCSISEACFYANVSRETYYNWVKAHPELLDRFNALRRRPVLIARQTLIKGFEPVRENGKIIKEGDPYLALKYLERKERSEFALKTEIDLAGNIKHEEKTSKEELEVLKKLGDALTSGAFGQTKKTNSEGKS
ncbi:hypothetical protein KKE60_08050 [Patescibacteria group bacterium]|nr:hypothetical protein [Patescibacteria group bacterium]